jgi:hypothetical protein
MELKLHGVTYPHGIPAIFAITGDHISYARSPARRLHSTQCRSKERHSHACYASVSASARSQIDDAAVARAHLVTRPRRRMETDHRTALNHFCCKAKRTYKMEETDSRRSGLSLLLSRSQV